MKSGNKKNTILIVDDHDLIRENYEEIFTNSGFEVVSAKDGVEALGKIDNNNIDVIFTGIIMPRMDGFQLLENLKKHTATSGIPVAVNSHLGREEDKDKMMELGADDFLVRDTVPPVKVVERINMLLENKRFILNIDKKSPDFDEFIGDRNFSESLTCPNCGGRLALELLEREADFFETRVICLECKNYY
ncbi:MAG: response regulator [Candidatus Moraniibacteriota bacterium]